MREQKIIAPPVLVFDGDCGFCTTATHFLRRFIDRRKRFAVVPLQFTSLPELGLTREQALASLQFVDEQRRASSGAAAVSQVLRRSGWGWRPVGWLLAAPGISWLAELLYRWVAAHRYQLPGGTPACKI